MRTMTASPIRMATPADVDTLLPMALTFLAQPPFADMGPASPSHVRAFLERLITSPDSIMLVGAIDGQIVGMIGAGLFVHPLTGQLTGQEVGWWVNPDRRGARLALELLAEAEAWARGAGAVVFQVQGPTPKVARFYARRGYRHYESGFFRRFAA